MQCPACSAERADDSSSCSACGSFQPPVSGGDNLRARLQGVLDDEYGIVRLLGRGGMGAVYLARELALERLVGIKVLPPEAADDPERRARFQREAQLAAQLTHPNIVPLHRFGQKAGLSYYVMGFVRGESLAERLRRDGRMAAEEVRLLLAQLADALEYAHDRGVVHRDIKPDNILIDDETGRPMLADFGIARKTGEAAMLDAGRIEGTLHYMSPEQTTGAASSDGRSDLYSLGVVGYVALYGQTPFTAGTFVEFARMQAAVDPQPPASSPPDAPSDLVSAIMRALARDPENRWRDARSFKEALGAALDEDPDRLPGELREVSGAAFYTVAGGWIGAGVVSLLLPPSIGSGVRWIVPLVFAFAYVATAWVHRKKGFTWAEMSRVALWPPGWWAFWWPRAHRRPWDLWDRLPPVVRRFRVLYGLVAAALVVGLPMTLQAGSKAPILVLLGSAQLAVTLLMLVTAWWAYRHAIPNNADLRSLILRSSADRRFWKRPQMARRLLPADVQVRTESSTPAEYVRNMSRATLGLTGTARETAVRAVSVARSACNAITGLDDQLGAPDTGSDADRRERISGRREELAAQLRVLWQRHMTMAHDQTDSAIRHVAMQAAALSSSLSGAELELDTGESQTFAASGTQLTRGDGADFGLTEVAQNDLGIPLPPRQFDPRT